MAKYTGTARVVSLSCIAISATDPAVNDIQIVNNRPKQKRPPFIYAPKSFYFSDEIIECYNTASGSASTWECVRSADGRRFTRETNILALSNEYFSITNAEYDCHCKGSETNLKTTAYNQEVGYTRILFRPNMRSKSIQ